MSPGHPEDVRLDTRQVAARLGVTPRHVARIPDLPRPHYLAGLKRWWLAEILEWEAASTTTTPPAALRRGAGNLNHGRRGADREDRT